VFISSHHDKYKDRILVWEKQDGKRVVREYDPPRYFYIPDKLGDYEAITGEKLKKLNFRDKTEYDQACMAYPQKFESDISPLEKLMMDVYCGKKAPQMTIGLVDIEVDYDPKIGFPRPAHPYAPVNALTLYRSDVDDYFTFLVPPKGWEGPLPDEMVAANYFICHDEREIFQMFFDLLDDVDVVSGWNSEFFDIPYLAKRAEMLYGASGLKKFAFERGPTPYWGEHERFKGSKEKEIVLNLGSRVHLDYLRLFRKFNLEGRQSFSLGAIADDELNIPKLHYEGTLYELYRGSYRPKLDNLLPEADWDDLYRSQVEREMLYQEIEGGHAAQDVIDAYQELDKHCRNLSFIKFATYNRRDVEVLYEIDKKFKYIELASEMVHEATVNFPAIFGSVQLIDTAIINYCHSKLGKIVFDRKHKPGEKVEGALVLTPKVGYHKIIGSCDINSLYPSTYRSLNLSPEKIVGQLLGYEADWRIVYEANMYPNDDLRNGKIVRFRLEGTPADEALEITAREMIDLLRDRKFALSAYGTVLDQGNGEGLLASVLSYWFKGRKELQAIKKDYAKKAAELLKQNGGNKEDPTYIEYIKQSDYHDMLQGVRKVLLNSTYGATLNEYCRFHDPRLGASTTGSGRQITTHMINTAAKGLVGDNAPKVVKTISIDKKTGENINEYTIACPDGIGPIYSDTDSVAGDSIIGINGTEMTVEDAFMRLADNYGVEVTDGREMVWVNPKDTQAKSLSGYSKLKGIYRHRTSKRRFKITLESGKHVIVTEDHSVMVEREGKLIEVKPLEINRDTDVCISIEV
jgi:DNA polymerase elongation subunit (family B)